MKKDNKGTLLNEVGFQDDPLLSLLQYLFDKEQTNFESFATAIADYNINQDQVSPNLSLLPLSSILIAWQYRNKDLDRKSLKVIYPILVSQHLQILSSREHPASGLPFLLDPKESLLPDASYWSFIKEGPTLEPAFIGLMAGALEALIFLGRQLKKTSTPLIEANELLIYSTNEYLWDDEYGIYFPYSISQKQQIVNNSIGGILPLIADLPEQEQAEAIHRALILNFKQEQHYYFPTECLEDGKEKRSINILVNWLLFQGLQRFEFEATAETLKVHSLQLLKQAKSDYLIDSKIPLKPNSKNLRLVGIPFFLELAFQQLKEVHFSNLG